METDRDYYIDLAVGLLNSVREETNSPTLELRLQAAQIYALLAIAVANEEGGGNG